MDYAAVEALLLPWNSLLKGTYQQLYSGNLEEKIVMLSMLLGEKTDRT